MRVFIICLLLAASLHAALAQQPVLRPHPVPWEFASERYSVRVNGRPVSVMLTAMNLHAASFDFTGMAKVQVEIQPNDYNRLDGRTYLKPEEFWDGRAVVRPSSRGITAMTSGRIVTFTLTQPGQYAIERPGTGRFEDEVLFVFANPPEARVPERSDPKVIWLGPGIHQQSVDLASGQTLYLESGAVLFGAVNVWDAENVRICGRGTLVYEGPNSRNLDSGWVHRKNWRPLTTHSVRGLRVEGITIVNRSRTWSIQLWKTTDTVFEQVKVIASTPENLNCDGIDWYDGGDAVVKDCFFRTADDCFAFYTAESSDIFRGDRGGGGRLRGVTGEAPVTHGEVKNIAIERCVLWPTVANVIRAGYVNQALTTRNITVRDCDVIHIGQPKNPWLGANWGLLSAVSTSGAAECRHSDYLFENLRIEEPATIFGVNWPHAKFTHFRFKDIHFIQGTAPSFLRGKADGITFDNVRTKGHPATTLSELDLTTEGEVENVRFSPP